MGKSTLLTQLTGTKSEAAAYEFTTLTCIPGVIHYNDAKIQLLDLPGIIEGAAQGKGAGEGGGPAVPRWPSRTPIQDGFGQSELCRARSRGVYYCFVPGLEGNGRVLATGQPAGAQSALTPPLAATGVRRPWAAGDCGVQVRRPAAHGAGCRQAALP